MIYTARRHIALPLFYALRAYLHPPADPVFGSILRLVSGFCIDSDLIPVNPTDPVNQRMKDHSLYYPWRDLYRLQDIS